MPMYGEYHLTIDVDPGDLHGECKGNTFFFKYIYVQVHTHLGLNLPYNHQDALRHRASWHLALRRLLHLVWVAQNVVHPSSLEGVCWEIYKEVSKCKKINFF